MTLLNPPPHPRRRFVALQVGAVSLACPLRVLFTDLESLNVQAPARKVAKAPGSSKASKKTTNPLFESRPKSFGIGAWQQRAPRSALARSVAD